MSKAIQDWVLELPVMQQCALFSSVRGPDGVTKNHESKDLIRFFRRSIFVTAFEGKVLNTPFEAGGGNFTGSSHMNPSLMAKNFFSNIDSLPLHFVNHFAQAIKIVYHNHPNKQVQDFWRIIYELWYNTVRHDMNKMMDCKETWMEVRKSTRNKFKKLDRVFVQEERGLGEID